MYQILRVYFDLFHLGNFKKYEVSEVFLTES